MMTNEMIMVTLKGDEAQLWRDIMGSLELEGNKGDYERFVNEVFVAGLMEFHKHISQGIDESDFQEAVEMVNSLCHALVLYNPRLDSLIESSVFINMTEDKVLIGYEKKQVVKGGTLFFAPDGVGVMIPEDTILDVDVEIELDFGGV